MNPEDWIAIRLGEAQRSHADIDDEVVDCLGTLLRDQMRDHRSTSELAAMARELLTKTGVSFDSHED